MKYTINKDTVTLEKVGKVKKITGTRFASILGLNVWNTPFEAWCDMTKLYKEPFVDNEYTIAGKVIEPIIIKYLDKVYDGKIIDPETYYGKDYQKMRFDFYPHEPIFGGMWDALVMGKSKPRAVIEIKTTKRVEDWEHDVPEYYKMQAMLYAYLTGVKYFIFAVAFLKDEDYQNPHEFVANDETVKLIQFDLDKDEIEQKMAAALEWYNKHIVDSLTSPEFDEKKDADILKELRTNRVEATETVEDYLAIIDEVKPIIERNDADMKVYTDKLKSAEDGLKKELESRFTDQDNSVSIKTLKYEFKVNRSVKEEMTFDEKQFKKDHPALHAEYSKLERKETVRKQIKKLEEIPND